MKNIVVFCIPLLFLSAHAATSLETCGEFRVFGEIVKNTNESGYSLLVNQNSKSEYQFKIKLDDELKISSYIFHKVEATLKISKKMNGMKGEIDKILKIKKIPINAIELIKKNNIEIILKSECLK